MHALVLSLFMLLVDAPASALVGKVTAPDGSAVTGATVLIYSATPKEGAPTMDTWEYPACHKSAQTDPAGAFTIAGMNPDLLYEVLVLSDKHRALMLKKVDVARGEVSAQLRALPENVEPELIVRGRMVDAKGEPVAGARVEPCSYGSGNSRTYGGESSVIETTTYTNAKGEFTLIAKKAGLDFSVRVLARDQAPMIARHLVGGDDMRDFTMSSGAKIVGKIVKDDKPIAGVKLLLVQEDRNSDTFLGVLTTYTNEQGQFTFEHAAPNTAYGLTASTKSLAGKGAVQVAKVRTMEDETTAEAGDMIVEPGQTLSGQLVAPKGKPSFAEAKVQITRADTWDDALEVSADNDGKFTFTGIATGLYRLTVKLDEFHLSKENGSADPFGGRSLMGRVDDDISDLKVQIDPGPPEPVTGPYNHAARQALESSRISGVESK